MKKYQILFLFVTKLSTIVLSQSFYKDYSEKDRYDFFYEDFKTNTNKYNIKASNNGFSSGSYKNGFFELKGTTFNQQGCIESINNEIDQSKDFEIESSIMFVSGKDNSAIGITWGANNNKKYVFGFSGNGKFSIFKYDNNTWIEIKNWTESSSIKKTDYNKLTIRKVNNKYYFFINETIVHSCKFENLYGNNIFIYVNDNQLIKINSIRISYLNKDIDNAIFQDNLPPLLSIQEISFSKNILKSNDTAKLSITLKNLGMGDASGVYINLSSNLKELIFSSRINVPVISRNGGIQTINIEIKSGEDLPTTEAILKIEVIETNFRVKIQGKQIKFPTKEFLKPELILAKFAVVENLSSNPNNQIDINEQIDVKLAIQNIGLGNSENINVKLTNNQNGVMLLGFVDNLGNLVRKNPTFKTISSGKFETITYRYFVNSEFNNNQLLFNITIDEKQGKYGFSTSKSVEINKILKEEGFIRKISQNNENLNNDKILIEDIQDFVSDVDQNIPINSIKNDNTFAVVIGNENYLKEIKVDYALNDSRVFKQYLQKTLGLPNNNIQYIENGTFGQILDALKWINDVIKAYNGKAKIIFFYAGHGMPDEQSKSAYLLPVDGSSQNPQTAVKLVNVYNKLTEFPSNSVTVFLDACFSGAAREQNSMLAEGRGVRIKPKNDLFSGNLVVLSAATGDETAFPYRDKQHGMFTYFLLKKIQETKGNVILGELSDYIITNVSQQSLLVNKKSQTPQVNSSILVQDLWHNFSLK